jgi:hypothetical protein
LLFKVQEYQKAKAIVNTYCSGKLTSQAAEPHLDSIHYLNEALRLLELELQRECHLLYHNIVKSSIAILDDPTLCAT